MGCEICNEDKNTMILSEYKYSTAPESFWLCGECLESLTPDWREKYISNEEFYGVHTLALEEKIERLLDQIKCNDKMKIYYKDEKDGDKIKNFISNGSNKEYLQNHLAELKVLGFIGYHDSNGIWTEYIDFEIIKED